MALQIIANPYLDNGFIYSDPKDKFLAKSVFYTKVLIDMQEMFVAFLEETIVYLYDSLKMPYKKNNDYNIHIYQNIDIVNFRNLIAIADPDENIKQGDLMFLGIYTFMKLRNQFYICDKV